MGGRAAPNHGAAKMCSSGVGFSYHQFGLVSSLMAIVQLHTGWKPEKNQSPMGFSSFKPKGLFYKKRKSEKYFKLFCMNVYI